MSAKVMYFSDKLPIHNGLKKGEARRVVFSGISRHVLG
jgi:hypothetical protein